MTNSKRGNSGDVLVRHSINETTDLDEIPDQSHYLKEEFERTDRRKGMVIEQGEDHSSHHGPSKTYPTYILPSGADSNTVISGAPLIVAHPFDESQEEQFVDLGTSDDSNIEDSNNSRAMNIWGTKNIIIFNSKIFCKSDNILS